MNYFDIYIILLFILKIVFIFLVIYNLYLKHNINNKENVIKDQIVIYWKYIIEFIFKALMSVLLIYLFNPRNSKLYLITNETKLLFFLFGFVLLFTADWTTFIKDVKLFSIFNKH